MTWSMWLKNVWYFLIILLLAWLFAGRLCAIGVSEPTTFDSLLLVLLVAVLLAPLFKVNLFGAGLEPHEPEAAKSVKTEKEADAAKDRLPTGHSARPLDPPDARTPTENKILNTLWTFQVNYFPDYSGLWTFRVHANAPSFVDFRAASARLISEGLVSESNDGQLFLTPIGFKYCQNHYNGFPREHWFPEEEMNPSRLKEALQTDPFNPPRRPSAADGNTSSQQSRA